MILRIIYLLSLIYKCYSLKKFTIHSEGENVITSKVSIHGECSAIAITQKGSFIKYRENSSIISHKIQDDLITSEHSKYFMCQFSTNKLILIRGNEIKEIEINEDGDFQSKENKESENSYSIFSLQCKTGYYIFTYLSDDDKKYNFKMYKNSNPFKSDELESENLVPFISSSCLLLDNNHVLCINTLSSEMEYIYHELSLSTCRKINSDGKIINSDNNLEIKGSIIKYWSNNEILICINAYKKNPLEDINLICYFANVNQINNIKFEIKDELVVNEKVTGNINYCQIEKLTSSSSNTYVSICLTFYYRTTYILSIFKYYNNKLIIYNNNNNYKDIEFSLLEQSFLSIIPFKEESFGIFFRDIDADSMILMFYPNCRNIFDYAPKEGGDCCNINDISGCAESPYYYDECTHSFMKMPLNYSIYERNQFCKIKKIDCNDNYYLDNNNNFGSYECWSKGNPPQTYYFDYSVNIFKKCFRTCLTCREGGDESNHNCVSCKENFYALQDNSFQCYHKDEPLNKYFFDSKNKRFSKCRKECLTCTELGNIIGEETDENQDTKCTKCLVEGGGGNNYWPQVDKPSNCIKSSLLTIKFYYAFEPYKSWERCFEGCLYCTELGTSIYDTKCTHDKVCSDGYYQVEDNPGNCFKKSVRYNHYYFDENSKIFKKCNEACLQCNEKGTTISDTRCLSSKCDELEGFYAFEDNPTICYKYDKNTYDSNNPPKYYYFDPNRKKYRKCQKGCEYCRYQINANINDTQCTQCDANNNFFKYSGNNNNINCYYKYRKGYYYYENPTVGQIMIKCPEKCLSCVFVVNTVKCTECNNDLGFYELDLPNSEINGIYKDCRTLRAEKIQQDIAPYPPTNTILVENVFKYCDSACLLCTGLFESKTATHCQAKQCSPNYHYILNYEDICYNGYLPYYFIYTDPNSHEKYYKPCYETCEICSESGNKLNNNCFSCRNGYIFHPNKITHPNNCIFNCLSINNYFYLDEDNDDEYTCVDKCPEKYPYLQPIKKQCIKSCKDEEFLKYSRDWICVSECPLGTKSNIFEDCVSISNNCIKSELESNYILSDINETNINEFIINYCHDYSYTSQQITIIKNKLEEYEIFIYKNKDCIYEFFEDTINFPDLSVCFDELKELNNINKNRDFIIMIMNIYNKNTSIQLEYKIFDSLDCKELDLKNCSVKNISTNINMNKYFSEKQIETAKKLYDKGIIVYNRTDPFFTDICYEFTSEDDKDIILEDRVDEFYQNVTNICEKNCQTDADFEKKELKCICELKSRFMENNNNITEENEKEYKFGIGPRSIEVIKCAKKALLWNYFKNNIGSYTALVLILAEIPLIIIFIKFGLNQVKVYLIPFNSANPPKNSLINNNESENVDNNIIDKSKGSSKEEEEKDFYSKNGHESINNNQETINNNILKNEINNINNENNYSEKQDISNKDNTDKNEYETNNSKTIKTSENNSDNNSNDSLLQSQYYYQKKLKKKKNYDIYKEINDYDDLNDVELFDAITFDKRSFCQFYWDELKRTQPIIYSFIIYTPLTPKFFKILLFIFNTIICFELNSFFYSKKYISDKYYGFKNDFVWYIEHIYDRILYVCICTIFLNLFIRVITNSKKKIQMWMRREKDKEKFNKEIIKMTNRMYINYIIFMSVQGLFMFFFWLYLSCFCNCYKNNEIEWFVSSLICFGIIQLWYFISAFIVACLRLLGIKFGMESCYNVSLCLSYD